MCAAPGGYSISFHLKQSVSPMADDTAIRKCNRDATHTCRTLVRALSRTSGLLNIGFGISASSFRELPTRCRLPLLFNAAPTRSYLPLRQHLLSQALSPILEASDEPPFPPRRQPPMPMEFF